MTMNVLDTMIIVLTWIYIYKLKSIVCVMNNWHEISKQKIYPVALYLCVSVAWDYTIKHT